LQLLDLLLLLCQLCLQLLHTPHGGQALAATWWRRPCWLLLLPTPAAELLQAVLYRCHVFCCIRGMSCAWHGCLQVLKQLLACPIPGWQVALTAGTAGAAAMLAGSARHGLQGCC
jgi:hypothetical protein